MNRAIFRKTWADVRSRPLQTVLLAVVILLAASTLTLAFALRSQAADPFDELMDDANGAHVWFSSSDRGELEEIAQRPGVTGAAGPHRRVWLEAPEQLERRSVSLWGISADLPAISRPILTSGRWLNAGGANEVVLESGYARALNKQPGDPFLVRTPTADTTFTVVGVALWTAVAPYPVWEPGHAFILPETLERLAEDGPGWELGVRLDDPGSTSQFVQSVLRESPNDGSAETGRELFVTEADDVREAVAEETEVTAIFFTIFSIGAIGAMALIIANTVSGAVLGQFREAGLLKAVGFTPSQVTWVFLLAQLGVGLVAAAVGALVGFALVPVFLDDVAGVLGTSSAPRFEPRTLLVVVLLVEVIVAVCALLPASRAGRISVVRSIAGRTELSRQASALSRVAHALRLPPLFVLGMKDAFARPLRAWFTVAALAIALGSTAMALSIRSTLSAAKDDPTMFSNETYDLRLDPQDSRASGVVDAARQDPRVESVVTDAFLLGTTDDHPQRFFIHALGEDVGVGFPDPSAGRQPSTPGEALVAERLAERLGVSPGDHVSVDLQFPDPNSPGEPRTVATREFEVVGLYEDSDEDGMLLHTLLESVAGLGQLPTSVGIRLKDVDESVAVAGSLRQTFGDDIDVDDEVEQNRRDMEDAINETGPILLGLNLMLLLVAGINVLTTLLFAIRERYREVGVLKAIGLTPRELLLTVPVGGCVLALIGAAIGIPAGLVITEQLFEYFGRGEGWKDGVAVTPAWWQLSLLVPLGLVLAALGSWLPAHRAASMPVTEALHWE